MARIFNYVCHGTLSHFQMIARQFLKILIFKVQIALIYENYVYKNDIVFMKLIIYLKIHWNELLQKLHKIVEQQFVDEY